MKTQWSVASDIAVLTSLTLLLLWNQFGRTEMILNCLNPKFSKKFVLDYYFEMVQRLKFCVYDIDNDTYDLGDDDFLGEIECTLGQVSFPRPGLWQFPLTFFLLF